MKKYFLGKVRVNNQVLNLEMELEKFIEKSGIEIDEDYIDEFTEDAIADYVLDQFDDCRYEMNIDDKDIVYLGYEILEEGHEELMSTYMDE